MQSVPINYLAVVLAAVAGFLVAWGWYGLLDKLGLYVPEKTEATMKPSSMPLIIAAVAVLVMAWMLAGLMGHLGDVTVKGGVISAFFAWVGFVLTTMGVNQAFQGKRPLTTAVDTGNWLAVLVVMGAIIGAFGV